MNFHAPTLLITCFVTALAYGCSERPQPSSNPPAPAATAQAPLTDSLTGIWVGTMAITGSTSASIRYEITDNNGQLSGIAFDLEPSRNQFIKTGTLTGTRTGTSAQWTSVGDTVSGTLSGDSFTGTLVVAADGPNPSMTAQVALERTACVAESDAAFCTRLNASCGQKTDADNCGVRRVVVSCGPCTNGTCTLNQCQP